MVPFLKEGAALVLVTAHYDEYLAGSVPNLELD
jgi:hypothetical protein